MAREYLQVETAFTNETLFFLFTKEELDCTKSLDEEDCLED